MSPHFYATGDRACLYCGAPGAARGEPCRVRAEREAAFVHASGQPYSPEQHLRAEARRRGLRLTWADEQAGPTPMRVWRVWRGDELVVEAAAVVAEMGARVCLIRLIRR